MKRPDPQRATRHRPVRWLIPIAALAIAVASSLSAVATDTAKARSPLGHAIVFTKVPAGSDVGTVYRIDGGGTVEHAIHAVFDAALLSPDGSQFLDFAPTPEGRGSAGIFNADGSGYRVLPLPARLELPGGQWSAGTTRIATGGGDPDDPTSIGIYSRRASNGRGLIRLTDAGSRQDYPAKSSPDGSKLLFFRPHARNETSDSAAQYVVGAHGGDLRKLTPVGTTTAIVFSYDSISWSPDGTRVAMAAATGPFWKTTSRSIFIANVDGSSFTRVGPRGDIWDAMWSPNGRWIAFTMATKETIGLHELFVMHPDGSGIRQLTSGSDGLFALQPTWSPDSDQILILRGTDDPHLTDIWSVNMDGSHLFQVTHAPSHYRALAWLP